ncbi:HlyD family type I secretion periplasmic adaptor subunit [Sphingobium sufflavum]|uniref:HlyD family type I secretion periplasmic adaptor subunit n=1 Tax=Sphingobium sufflavum TaxID=1129547 RepID=UPI001F15BC36|nr:HlyD family type I secretion periplasmic adaptor subunit [Sphingobium sufflavum]
MSYRTPAVIDENRAVEPILEDPHAALQRSYRHGLIVIGLFFAGILAMAAFTGTRGAIIGVGEVTVETRVKKIAHPSGGVIAELLTSEGQRVKRGQVLMRLENGVSGISASAASGSAEQMAATAARLTAERDGAAAISFPASLTTDPTPAKQAAMQQASSMFQLQRQLQASAIQQSNERVRQTEQQIASLQAEMAAVRRQNELVKPELEGLRSLRDRQLVTINRLNQIERTAVDLEGQVASFGSQIAQARARIAEIRQSGLQLVQDARSRAGAELVEVQARLSEQTIRSATAQDTFDRSLVRAPYDGVVAKLAYSTVGGIVPPLETILEIVPTHDPLTVEAKISPMDIDQVSAGQRASLRFSAFSSRITPEVEGNVTVVSAERVNNERTGESYYKVQVEVTDAARKKLGNLKLVPGMPVEVFIQTSERSLLSYLTKPIRDQFNRAFRED